ncbi:MAG TPA: hypothetical protein VK730_01270 [Solirubrobacteraceae bacterium]|nr:hypothetical protein [Solirubrobacteraceae bacterium]
MTVPEMVEESLRESAWSRYELAQADVVPRAMPCGEAFKALRHAVERDRNGVNEQQRPAGIHSGVERLE